MSAIGGSCTCYCIWEDGFPVDKVDPRCIWHGESNSPSLASGVPQEGEEACDSRGSSTDVPSGADT